MDLTESELFENLLEIKTTLFHFDLHNDYTCLSISYSGETLVLEFKKDNDQSALFLEFKEVTILSMKIPLKTTVLDNFHRGRYELNGDLYDEFQGKKCFYIEFYEEGSIELLCRHVLLNPISR
jgi:hypothetical protein